MAKDAIETVRGAEEKAKALLQDASQISNDSIHDAEVFAEEEYKRILLEANTKAEEIKRLAVEQGESVAKPIIEKGIGEAKELSNLGDGKIDSAINIIIERIVNANGNS